MLHEFSRTQMLLGSKSLDALKEKTVVVFGIGGVGGHCAEALARCGFGRIVLIDNDIISLTNINRQLVALHSTLGRHKTEVMKERIQDISPQTEVILHNVFVTEQNLKDVLPSAVDFIIDAIDTVTAKLAIAKLCEEQNIPLISSMGTGNKLYPEQFEISDISKTIVCPLCKVMRRECRARGIKKLTVLYSRELPLIPEPSEEEKGSGRPVPGSISFVPPAAGLMLAGYVIRSLTEQ